MSKSTDERGRLYLPKDVRERFGSEYRVVELPNYVALFPVAEDPLQAVQDAVGDALADRSIEELQTAAHQHGRAEVAAERDAIDDEE